jgi:hypothetical protein
MELISKLVAVRSMSLGEISDRAMMKGLEHFGPLNKAAKQLMKNGLSLGALVDYGKANWRLQTNKDLLKLSLIGLLGPKGSYQAVQKGYLQAVNYLEAEDSIGFKAK